MWIVPVRWWQVPGFLIRAWTSSAASRPSRSGMSDSIAKIRRQIDSVRPEVCCTKQTMVAGGKRTMVCSSDCPWQKLDLLIANASVDADLIPSSRGG